MLTVHSQIQLHKLMVVSEWEHSSEAKTIAGYDEDHIWQWEVNDSLKVWQKDGTIRSEWLDEEWVVEVDCRVEHHLSSVLVDYHGAGMGHLERASEDDKCENHFAGFRALGNDVKGRVNVEIVN